MVVKVVPREPLVESLARLVVLLTQMPLILQRW